MGFTFTEKVVRAGPLFLAALEVGGAPRFADMKAEPEPKHVCLTPESGPLPFVAISLHFLLL